MGALQSFADAVHADLDEGVEYGVGGKYLSEHLAPPFVTWVAPKVLHTHDVLDIGPTSIANSTDLRKSFITRALQIEVHVWHNSLDEAEDLLKAIMAAAYRVDAGKVAWRGEAWDNDARNNLLQHGEQGVLLLTYRDPVEHARHETVTLANAAETTKDIVDSL